MIFADLSAIMARFVGMLSYLYVFLCGLVLCGASKRLPDKVIVGYPGWNECDNKTVLAVEQGVNVVIWFSILLKVENGAPVIFTDLDLKCVRQLKAYFEDQQLDTLHMISVGGWNQPHPDTSVSPEDMYQAWVSWNDGLFDGLDWDVEGVDTKRSEDNMITFRCLHLMGRMSQLAKDDGYIVSMAPAESYLDPRYTSFDTLLLHDYQEYRNINSFHYHGRNVYAYLLYHYSTTPLGHRTFDFISIQLYESYAHALYNISYEGADPAQYLVSFVQSLVDGWSVNFDTEPAHLHLDATQVVIGLANGWANVTKTLLLLPEDASRAYKTLQQTPQYDIRGFMFWDIMDEGRIVTNENGEQTELWMAEGLNSFMKIR